MRRTLGLAVACSLLALPFLAAQAAAQETGAVAGTVTGTDGRPVSGAAVMVDGTNLGALSGADGRYTIANVPAGAQTIVVRFIGLRTARQQVTVVAGETATADFTLEVDALAMDEIVVTGTRTEARKIESSTAITTISAPEIRMRAPRSTADLVKVIPGFYVEDSGGDVGGNLWARGLPADGSFRYVALLEDGMPVFDATELSFVNADIFVRVDQNIETVEAVRGGNAALFGSNAPGGLINFRSRTGGPELAGSFGAMVGTDDINRYDFNLNGPIGDEWRFNLGGFFRFDQGIRDPGFPASKGGQVKANLTRLLDDGFIRIYGKYLNDRNTFFLPVPVRARFAADGKLTGTDVLSGFGRGTLTSREGIDVRVPLPRNNGDVFLPLDNGQRQVGGSVMAEFDLGLENDWRVNNKIRFMDINHSWNAMVPFDVANASDWAQGFVDGTPGGAGFRLTCTNVLDANDNPVGFGTGACENPNDLVLLGGQWLVEKPLSNVSNQLTITKTAVAGTTVHNFNVGSYFGHYNAGNTWFFNDILTNVRSRPNFLDLEILDVGGNVIRQVTERGFRGFLPLFVQGTSNATLFAFFAGDEIQIGDRWRIDLAGRFERDVFEQNAENTRAFDLGGPADADDAANFGIGTFKRVDVDFDEWAASLGVNYLVTDRVAVYGRAARGYKMPILDQFLFSTDPDDVSFPNEAETLYQAEGGLKVGSPTLGLSAVVYWLLIQDFPSSDVRVDPITGETRFVTVFAGEARTIGTEIEAIYQPNPYLRGNVVFTFQDPKLTEFLEGDDGDLSGNRVRRIPRVLWDVTGTAMYEGFSFRANWNFIGHRFSNNANTIDLKEFGVVNLGAALELGGGTRLQLDLLNALKGEGLTEGNPRIDETLGAQAEVFLARPVLPRRFQASIGYTF